MQYVRLIQDACLDYTTTHVRQLWDFVRDLWWSLCPSPGLDRAEAPITTDRVWDFLLGVYRRQGGGGVARNERLPTPCIKGLAPPHHHLSR